MTPKWRLGCSTERIAEYEAMHIAERAAIKRKRQIRAAGLKVYNYRQKHGAALKGNPNG